jgi:hypothetical protein
MNIYDADYLEGVFSDPPPFFPRVYTARPYDEKIAAFLKEFAAAPAEARAKVTENLTESQRCALIGFAQGAAQFAVQEKSMARILEALLALAAEGFREDYRESLVVLSAIHHSITLLGEKPNSAFKQAISLADSQAAKYLKTSLKSPTPIKSFLIVAVDDEEGFRYKRNW